MKHDTTSVSARVSLVTTYTTVGAFRLDPSLVSSACHLCVGCLHMTPIKSMTCSGIASLIEMPHVDPINTAATGMKQLNRFYVPSVNDSTTFPCAQSFDTRIETDHPLHQLCPYTLPYTICHASPDGAAALGT